MFKYSISFVTLFLCHFAFAQGPGATSSERPVLDVKPEALDWKKIKLPSLKVIHKTVNAAEIFMLPEGQSKQFKLCLVFPSGTFQRTRQERVPLQALVDLMTQSGAGKRNSDQVTDYLKQNGLSLGSQIYQHHVEVCMQGLTVDFSKATELLTDILLKPTYNKKDFDLWKQDSLDSFESLLDASTRGKQAQFMMMQTMAAAFGEDHFFSQAIFRKSPKALNSVTLDQVKKLHSEVVQQDWLQAYLAGGFSYRDETTLLQLIGKLPQKTPVVTTWLVDRTMKVDPEKTNLVILNKADMKQTTLSISIFLDQLGQLNTLENVQYSLLREVFSSSGGVTGNDRFSKAMRADSGISYTAHADFDDDFLFPNTNVGRWTLTFESPNDRVKEAVNLALKTWETFVSKGIQDDELNRARVTLMNRLLAEEMTIFNKADDYKEATTRGWLGWIDQKRAKLAALENQTRAEELNKLLKVISKRAMVVVTMMGNPASKDIKELKGQKNFKVSSEVVYSDLIKSIAK